jgi:glutamine synthetase
MSSPVMKLIKDHEVAFVDFRFVDSIGKEHHTAVSAKIVDEDFIKGGKMFDGSSIAGWREINHSDMMLAIDESSAVLDPFTEETTLNVRCNVVDPDTMKAYSRCPRSVAERAEAYLKTTGIADTCYIGPEPEFFIFDSVLNSNRINGCSYSVDSMEGAWNSDKTYEDGNTGHRPLIKGGYFPVPPVDSSHDLRSAMCLILEKMGLTVENHHHEVATANQNEITTECRTLTRKADEMLIFKYVVHNVAHAYGKTATFMPKPLFGDNGSGMHVHQSLSKNGKNLFAGDVYGNLSEMALHYIGGIIKHAQAINAFTNATTNSYKRLVPGYEAPVMLAYSSHNRSAAIRVPYTNSEKARRIEVRFPDCASNPYLGFAAMLMAGLDGIQNKIHPGKAAEENLYELTKEEARHIPTVCSSLEQALAALQKDHAFLTAGGVFSEDLINAYIELKMVEVDRFRMAPHPIEFEMYYSL